MSYCKKCGTQNTGEANYCASCGTKQMEVEVISDTDMQKHETKTMSILAYIIFFIPLIAGAHKKSEFIRFHTNQGTVLCIAAIIVGVIVSILTAVLIFIPGMWLIIPFFSLVWLLFPAFVIIGIINVANDVMKPLPIIGRFTIIK